MKKKIAYIYNHYIGVLVKAVGIVMVLSVLLQILARYLPGSGFRWTEELSRLLFLWFCFLSAAIALTRDGHLGIDYFYGKLSPKKQYVLDYVSVFSILGFSLLIAYYGFQLVQIVSMQRSPILRLPMSFFYAPVPVGAFLFIVYELAALADMIKGKRLHDIELEEGTV